MDINKKIEEIRQKPEQERLRYVLFWVVGCMIFIVLIWLLSLSSSFTNRIQEDKEDQQVTELKQQVQEIKKSAPSIEQFKKEALQQAPDNQSNSRE
jgi:type II secretory pathway component PulM